MKKNLCLFMMLTAIPFPGHAQWIDSLWVVPANPTTLDTVSVYAKCKFPSGTCFDHTQSVFVTPPVITANALHCLGILTYICDHTDTFTLTPLAAGSYTFIFQVNAGQGPSPCTPGIVPGPVDSIVFHVSNPAGIPSMPVQSVDMQLIPGNRNGLFHLWMPSTYMTGCRKVFYVYNMQGQQVNEFSVTRQKTEIDLSFLDAGFYFIKTVDPFISRKAIKICIQ